MRAANPAAGRELQDALGDRHRHIPGNDVNMVWLDGQVLRRLQDGQVGDPGQQVAQLALVLGVEVLHHHNGHAGFLRQVREQVAECLQAPGRGANPHDDEWGIS